MHDSQHAPLPAPALAKLPRRLRGRLAALSVLGALVVALPLGQVLRYQSAELQALAAQRSGLDPVARTVDVQRGLLVHRDITGLVLRGRKQLENERRVRQGEVDDRLATLASALSGGAWDRAVRESDALREDWLQLVRDLQAHSIGATESDRAHRLLVEQTLQVLDLLSDASAPHALRSDVDGPTLAWAAALTLPRLSAQLAALAKAGPETERAQRDLAAAEARLARTLGALNAALERPQRSGLPQRQVLALASARAGAAADRYFQMLRSEGSQPADLQIAATAALQAQYALFDGVASAVGNVLDERHAEADQGRKLMLGLLGLLALACLALVAQMSRGLDALARPALRRATDAPGPTPNPDRVAAGLLLQRLREVQDGAPVAPQAPAPQTTPRKS